MGYKYLMLKLFKLILDNIIKPIIVLGFKLYYRNIDHKYPLPKTDNPLIFLPANKLAEKIRKKEITSLQIVQIYIDRIKEIQPYVNCVVRTCFDEAIEEAKRVDKLLESDTLPEEYSVENAPLLGVPFSCKESIAVEGMPNSTGIIARKDYRSPKDADVVRYIRKAGAILTCLTNTSEVCMWFESSNYLYGTTKNPYNLSRLVGGSSGGEGCAVSSTCAVIGIGSDIGGSIRMPAFFNGVYGHKPTTGLISNKEQHPPAIGIQEEMLGTGPICRYASDLKVLLKIFAGPRQEELDNKFKLNIDFRKHKFYYVKELPENFYTTPPSANTRNALEKAVSFVEREFSVKVNELSFKKLRHSFLIWTSMMSNGNASSDTFSRLLNDSDIPVNPYLEMVKSLVGLQKKHTLPAIGLAITQRVPLPDPERFIELGRQLRDEMKIILGDDGILFFPSFTVVAPYHNQPLFTNTFDYLYYGILNSMGFPVTQCPMGLSDDGLPTGVQIVSNLNNDHLTIKLAEYFESNLVGWIPPFTK